MTALWRLFILEVYFSCKCLILKNGGLKHSFLLTCFFCLFFFKQISYYLCSRDNTIGLNMTNTFLVFAEEEIGEVLRIRLSWEGESDSWSSMWKNIKKNFWGWNANPSKPVLEVRRMRVKAGESQKKWAEGSKLQLPVLMVQN